METKRNLKLHIFALEEELVKYKRFFGRDSSKQLTPWLNRSKEPAVIVDGEKLNIISKSLINLTLPYLRTISRHSLIQILLVREKLLYDKINEFNETLKYNDRKVFHTLKDDNENLREYLINENKGYKEAMEMKEKLEKMKKEKLELYSAHSSQTRTLSNIKSKITIFNKKNTLQIII